MQLAKRFLIQAILLTAVAAAVGIGDLAIRGKHLKTKLDDRELPELPPADEGDDVASNEPETTVPEAPEVEPDQPDPTPPPVTQAETDGGVDPLAEPDELPPGHVRLANAYAYFERDLVTFFDARQLHEFEEGRIAGSIHLPISAFDSGDPDWLWEHDPDRVTILYCGGGNDCEAATDVAIQLEGSGFSQVFVLHVGYPGWEAAGYPIEVGPQE